MKCLFMTICAVVFMLTFMPTTFAQDEKISPEHPVIKTLPGFVANLKSSKVDSFGSMKIKPKGEKSFDVRGIYRTIRYGKQVAGGARRTKLQPGMVLGNYNKAALDKGGKVLRITNSDITFSIPRSDGGKTYCNVHVASTDYIQETLDVAGLNKVLNFGADEMKLALDKDGRIAIYGINFDTNKADLKLGAEKTISEIVKLLQMYPDLKVEIQGHTDDTGSADHNMTLSNQRAGTVKNFIMLYGVSESQLVSKGYGMTVPLVPNDSDENRAINRRVELVKK